MRPLESENSFLYNALMVAYILMGIKHSGKSTLGMMLSKWLDCPFFDTDEIIARNAKKSVRELYTTEGAAAFMLAEERACASLHLKLRCAPQSGTVAERTGGRLVVATGGGIADNAGALESLRGLGRQERRSLFVFLQVPEETAASRILSEADFSKTPPSCLPAFIAKYNPTDENAVRQVFHTFYEKRTAAYRVVADVIVPLSNESVEVNFGILKEALHL